MYVDCPILRDANANPADGLEQRHYVQHDANFNVTAITDPAGTVVERYLYDPYGTATVLTGNWQPTTGNEDWQYLHQGGRYDPATGLYYFRNRDYSAELGRWVSQDPLGYVDGLGLYAYTRSQPVHSIDPLGLWTPQGLLDAYYEKYGEGTYGEFMLALAGGIRVEKACTWFDDWYVDGNTIYIADKIWFGSERSNNNAAAQLNEALSIHFDVGSTSWLYKSGRFLRGTLKTAAGALTVTAGKAASSTGVGALVGVPLIAFGVSTAVEGATQAIGLGEGEGGINPGRELASLIGGDNMELAYNLTDLGISVIGGGAALKNISSTQKFQLNYLYRSDGTKVYHVVKGAPIENAIQRTMVRVEQPWKLILTGHSIEAANAGQATAEFIDANTH